MDAWNPQQYKKFENERAQPFWDLAARVDFHRARRLLDIGCGTGELTQALHLDRKLERTLGVDSSASMLAGAERLQRPGLSFEQADVTTFAPAEKFDVVFSNAALQWVDHHHALFPRLLDWLAPRGQLAVQMPYNHEHISHRLAQEIAVSFAVEPRPLSLLADTDYARLLWDAGLRDIDVWLKVYLHPMRSAQEIVEWTKGTLLTYYQKRLSPERYDEFLREYTRRLLSECGEGEYLYPFKRLFLYAARA
jgi:trans-aconitate 2-methyltransferase